MQFDINFVACQSVTKSLSRPIDTSDIKFIHKCLNRHYLNHSVIAKNIAYYDNGGVTYGMGYSEAKKIPEFDFSNTIDIGIRKTNKQHNISSNFLKRVITLEKDCGVITALELSVRLSAQGIFDFWLLTGRPKNLALSCRIGTEDDFIPDQVEIIIL